MDTLAPVILFVYNRVDHIIDVIEHLKKNPEAKDTHLYIYSDAAKDDKALLGVEGVRSYIASIEGFQKVTIIERTENYGIEKQEISAITEILKKYSSAIVLEDDILVAPSFLSYMNSALKKYEHEKRVFGISGFSYLEQESDCVDTMFLQMPTPWGWATWSDRWNQFEHNPTRWMNYTRTEIRRFNLDNSYDWYNMMKNQYYQNHEITWDVRWHLTIFEKNGLFLWPACPFSINAGFDGSGVHCPDDDSKIVSLPNRQVDFTFPKQIKEKWINRKRVGVKLREHSYTMTYRYRFAVFRNHMKIRLLRILGKLK